jgi:large subunit ribosomal protein L32
MAVPKKKTSKSRKNMRRAHDFLTPTQVSVCPSCKAPKLSHRACPTCGMYKGKEVIDLSKAQ